ncbi:MAG: hypothetical protein BWY96_03110 [Spirochaetes bacterium ADurb.BinA120]|nr:MAG: hypothetical protein BWY96_03110 [Spirochaetes bacterium ADurb.BinA120]
MVSSRVCPSILSQLSFASINLPVSISDSTRGAGLARKAVEKRCSLLSSLRLRAMSSSFCASNASEVALSSSMAARSSSFVAASSLPRSRESSMDSSSRLMR